MHSPASVVTGVSRLCGNPGLLTGQNAGIGLFTNFTGTMPDLGRNVDALRASGIALTALFSPEHGLHGSAQAGESEPDGVDERSRLPVFDTYLRDGAALDALLRQAGIRHLLVDLQDVGARFYTYTWSMFDLMLSAARLGTPVTVLDRPNPLSSLGAQGPGVDAGCFSFVGRASIPLLHALTLGELARRFNAVEVPERAGRSAELHVVTMENWRRGIPVAESGEPWVPPSPNLPTPTSAQVYPGTCVFEGTNASEGRGSTHPFELIGAGWVDGRYVDALRERRLPGVAFRDAYFVPSFSKWAGQRVRGVQLHIIDPDDFAPLVTGVTMLQVMAELYPAQFRFLEPEAGSRPFIDLLWGSDVLRTNLGESLDTLLALSPKPVVPGSDVRLYD